MLQLQAVSQWLKKTAALKRFWNQAHSRSCCHNTCSERKKYIFPAMSEFLIQNRIGKAPTPVDSEERMLPISTSVINRLLLHILLFILNSHRSFSLCFFGFYEHDYFKSE